MALIYPRSTSRIETTFGSAALVELMMKTSTEVMNSPGASSKIPVDGISLARTENENQGHSCLVHRRWLCFYKVNIYSNCLKN